MSGGQPGPLALARKHRRRLAILEACTERRMTSVQLAGLLGWHRDTIRDDGALLVNEGLLNSCPGSHGGYDTTEHGTDYLATQRG